MLSLTDEIHYQIFRFDPPNFSRGIFRNIYVSNFTHSPCFLPSCLSLLFSIGVSLLLEPVAFLALVTGKESKRSWEIKFGIFVHYMLLFTETSMYPRSSFR
ncbi:hypothetical protein V6N13_059350 [Hibiscus sabdariffa]